MNNHLEYEKYDRKGLENSRNGNGKKQLIIESGAVDLELPKDRNSKFEPEIVSDRWP
ncbi:MAG: hypothetical protein DGJ47_001177 [Rickettsiaceae bacterium]